MTGINILNKTEIMEYSNTQNVIITVAFAICIISLVMLLISFATLHDSLAISGIILVIVSFVIILITFGVGKIHHTGRYKYRATIDKTVPITEVYKKYDVIKQKGDLWVLKDKEKLHEQ